MYREFIDTPFLSMFVLKAPEPAFELSWINASSHRPEASASMGSGSAGPPPEGLLSYCGIPIMKTMMKAWFQIGGGSHARVY